MAQQQYSMDDILALAEAASQKYDIPVEDLMATAKVESNFNPKAKSPAGAGGMMQWMPGTAEQYKIDPFDVPQAIDGTARLRRDLTNKYKTSSLLANGMDVKTLVDAAYNAGSGNVDKFNGIPPFLETQDYTKKMSTERSKFLLDNPQYMPTPVVDTTAGATGALAGQGGVPTAEEEPKKKSSFWSKALPLLLRTVLPTVAGAAIGWRNPFLGAGPGALAGLTSGGLGYLNNEAYQGNLNKKNAMELVKQDYTVAKDLKEFKLKEDKFGFEKLTAAQKKEYDDWRKENKLADDKFTRDKFEKEFKLKEAELQIKKDNTGSSFDKTMQGKLYNHLDSFFQGRPLPDVNTEEGLKAVYQALAGFADVNLKVGDVAPGEAAWYNSLKDNPEAVKAYFEAWTRYRGNTGATLPTALPTAGKQLDAQAAQQFLQAAGGDKTKARQLAADAGYTF